MANFFRAWVAYDDIKAEAVGEAGAGSGYRRQAANEKPGYRPHPQFQGGGCFASNHFLAGFPVWLDTGFTGCQANLSGHMALAAQGRPECQEVLPGAGGGGPVFNQHIQYTAAGQADSGVVQAIGSAVADAVDAALKFAFLQAFEKVLFHTAA